MTDIELKQLNNFSDNNKVLGVENGFLVWKDFNITDYIENTEKGANDGVATLDGSGKVPTSQLPDRDWETIFNT